MPISRRFLLLLATFGLWACGKNDNENLRDAEKEAALEAPLDGKIECALAGSASFERNCTTEQIGGRDGLLLVIRHADGGFRRFRILTDGRGLAPADGFDDTKIKVIENGLIEVSSGDDIYRLPARIKGRQAPPGEALREDSR